jgi:hypothetical protein
VTLKNLADTTLQYAEESQLVQTGNAHILKQKTHVNFLPTLKNAAFLAGH